jgi:hypothetical protein
LRPIARIQFARREINKIQEIIEENQQHLLDSWHELFNG